MVGHLKHYCPQLRRDPWQKTSVLHAALCCRHVLLTVLPADHTNTTSHCDQVPPLLIQEFSDSVIDGHVLEGVQNFRCLGAL